MPVVLRDTEVIKEERKHVQTLWVVGKKVQDPPVLLNVGFGIRFQCMDHVREFHSITDEEDREVVPNKIKVPLSFKQRVRRISRV